MIDVVDLKECRSDCRNLDELQAILKQLVGQRFRFFRVAYGDELRLHLGDVRHSARGIESGSYVVAARASSWVVNSAPTATLLASGDAAGCESPRRADIKVIEAGGYIDPEAILLSAKPVAGRSEFMLLLHFSDGSNAFLGPDVPESVSDDEAEPDGTEISDWEILTPHSRILIVGPGCRWSYDDSTRNRAG